MHGYTTNTATMCRALYLSEPSTSQSPLPLRALYHVIEPEKVR